jgi:hypothetical protein
VMIETLKWLGHGAIEIVGTTMWRYLIVYRARALGREFAPVGADHRDHRPVCRLGVVHTLPSTAVGPHSRPGRWQAGSQRVRKGWEPKSTELVLCEPAVTS